MPGCLLQAVPYCFSQANFHTVAFAIFVPAYLARSEAGIARGLLYSVVLQQHPGGPGRASHPCAGRERIRKR